MKNFPPHLIVFIILLAFSGISYVYRQLMAQQAKKRLRDREEQRQLEVLRTGRDPSAEAQKDNAEALRQRELAARREAQLAELRRRAQERARQQTREPTLSAPPTAAPRTALPPPIPRPIPATTRPTAPISPPSPVRTAPRQTSRVQSQSQPLPAVRARQKQSAAVAIAPQTVPHHEVVIPIKSPVIQVNVPRTPEEWRGAILASEIMAKPLALREAPPALPF